jgi:hypothetical protein
MKLRSVHKRFFQRLRVDEPEMGTRLPEEGVEVTLAFYASERVENCPVDRGGDKLLYQWGMYDKRSTPLEFPPHGRLAMEWSRSRYSWASGEAFQFSLSRWLDHTSAGDYLWLLGLTFKFRPTDSLRQLGAGSRWCQDPTEVFEFRAFILASLPFAAVGRSVPDGIAVEFGARKRESVETFPRPSE